MWKLKIVRNHQEKSFSGGTYDKTSEMELDFEELGTACSYIEMTKDYSNNGTFEYSLVYEEREVQE